MVKMLVVLSGAIVQCNLKKCLSVILVSSFYFSTWCQAVTLTGEATIRQSHILFDSNEFESGAVVQFELDIDENSQSDIFPQLAERGHYLKSVNGSVVINSRSRFMLNDGANLANASGDNVHVAAFNFLGDAIVLESNSDSPTVTRLTASFVGPVGTIDGPVTPISFISFVDNFSSPSIGFRIDVEFNDGSNFWANITGLQPAPVVSFASDLDCDGIADVNDNDIDGDGIPNDIEDALGLNKASALDADMDLDGDGWSNQDEQLLGTSLNNGLDTPIDRLPGDIRIYAQDGEAQEFFGHAVALEDNLALIGAWQDSDKGRNAGAVYAYRLNEHAHWIQIQKIFALDGGRSDVFGYSLALSGKTAVIGAYKDFAIGVLSGSAYVFDYYDGVWHQTTKLTAEPGDNGRMFGYSVAIEGDNIIVGSYRGSGKEDYSGVAYMFDRESGVWQRKAKLMADDSHLEQRFGWSVALSSGTAVVGAVWDSASHPRAGAVYTFIKEESGLWAQESKLTAIVKGERDHFGWSVAIEGNHLIVGAPGDNENGADAGAAYIFTRNQTSWAHLAKLLPSDGASADEFGYNVDLMNNYAIASAVNDGGGALYSFEYRNKAWSEVSKLKSSFSSLGEHFGQDFSVDDNTILIGAPFADDIPSNSGSVNFMNTSSLLRVK